MVVWRERHILNLSKLHASGIEKLLKENGAEIIEYMENLWSGMYNGIFKCPTEDAGKFKYFTFYISMDFVKNLRENFKNGKN
jgi:hypothetical protein